MLPPAPAQSFSTLSHEASVFSHAPTFGMQDDVPICDNSIGKCNYSFVMSDTFKNSAEKVVSEEVGTVLDLGPPKPPKPH